MQLSICIPTYNRRALLQATLESLRAQTFHDYEIIVCDDCSPDDTWDYLQSLRWPNLHVLRNERNLHLAGTMTRLFNTAQGEFVGMQHDHDLYGPHFAERMVRLLQDHPSAGFACCAYYLLDNAGRLNAPDLAEFRLFPDNGIIPGQALLRVIATHLFTPIPAMSTVFRRAVVEQVGGYRSTWQLAADEDLYRRIAAISDMAYVHERLFTLADRPPERRSVMGSWRGLYNNTELRYDLIETELHAAAAEKRSLKAGITWLAAKDWLLESLAAWLCGDRATLRGALDFQTVRRARPVLPGMWRLAARGWLTSLRLTAGIGQRIGSFRRARHGTTKTARQKELNKKAAAMHLDWHPFRPPKLSCL